MSFFSQPVPDISLETRCRVFHMDIGDLAKKMLLSDESVFDIKDQAVILVQRTDCFGPGTRCFSSPGVQRIKQKIATDTAEAPPTDNVTKIPAYFKVFGARE